MSTFANDYFERLGVVAYHSIAHMFLYICLYQYRNLNIYYSYSLGGTDHVIISILKNID